MATYTYETIPQTPDEEPVRFELQQSMLDDALTEHPDTGTPVRRVITGGFGLMGLSKSPGPSTPSSGGHQHGSGCGFQ